MPQTHLPYTTFQDSQGNPLANGFAMVRLDIDVSAGSGQICARKWVKLLLDGTGAIIGSPVFWTTASLSPSGSNYIIEAFNSNGELVFGPVSFQL